MNKKGFTLVELLFSFSLVIIVVGIFYQIFTKEIANSKENAYQRQISTIINIAKDYHLKNPETTYVMINDLQRAGLIENVIDPRNGSNISGCVKFIHDSYYNQYIYEYKNISEAECR